jgi:antitoxin component YwqK of YwqJK toxin-antitoxin module
MKFAVVCGKIYTFVQLLKSMTMRKTLIITMMALFAMPVFAQTIESVDVSKAKDGKFTTQSAECTIEGYVVKGQKVGTWMEYYNSNTYLPKRIINYENGKKNGVYVEIDKTGSIEKKAEYKNDALDGQVSEWYRGGRLSKLNSYKNGKLDGKQILCYEKGGNLEVSNYKDGERDGETTWFDENGNKKMTIEYKNGQFDGKQETFYSDGSLKSEAVYKDGKLQGKKKTYAEKEKPAKDKKEAGIKKDKEKNIKGNIKEVNNGKEIKGKKDFNKGVKKP